MPTLSQGSATSLWGHLVIFWKLLTENVNAAALTDCGLTKSAANIAALRCTAMRMQSQCARYSAHTDTLTDTDWH